MPQLDVATYATQIFWLVVAFSVLFYLLRKKALPRVAEILEARQDRMAADLDRAQALRAEAEQTLATYEKLLAEAQEKARAGFAETQARLSEEEASRHAEAERDIHARIAEAEARIDAAKNAALAEIREVAIEVSRAAVTRLIGVEVNRADAEQAVESVSREAA
jgi:F-type H+-transporting ATPase subunit b